MPRIYISCRPEDSSRNEIGIIRQRLSDAFGSDNVLQTTDDHSESTTEIQKRVRACDVLLVVIGRWWANMVDEEGNYLLHNPYDPIHVEIDAGLRSRMSVRVLIVDGAPLPDANQLPDALKSLRSKTIIEAPDDDELDRMLDAFIEQVSSKTSRTTADAQDGRTQLRQGTSSLPSIDLRLEEQQRRDLEVGERVRQQSVPPPRLTPLTGTASEPSQASHPLRLIRRIVVVIIVIAIGAIVLFPADKRDSSSKLAADIAPAVESIRLTNTAREIATAAAVGNTPVAPTRIRISPTDLKMFSNQITFSTDSRYLFAHQSAFQLTTLVDTTTRSTISTALPDRSYSDAQFVSDTRVVLLYEDENEDKTLTVWDVDRDQAVIDAYGVEHLNSVSSRFFANNSGIEAILITADDKIVRWWVSSEATSILSEIEFDYDDSLQYEIELDVANQVFTISDRDQLRVYDLTSLALIATLAQPDPAILYHAFMPDDGALLLINEQGDVSVWDYRENAFEHYGQIDIVDRTRPYVRLRLTYDPVNQYIYTSYLTKFVRIDIWDINTMQRLLHYGPPANANVISGLLVSPDGRYLASMNDTVLYTIQEG